jgi:hypothetical protein
MKLRIVIHRPKADALKFLFVLVPFLLMLSVSGFGTFETCRPTL